MTQQWPTSDPSGPDEESAAEALVRKRRRWKWRVWAGAVALLVGTWGIWALDSSRMLEKTVAASLAQGDPQTLEALHGTARGSDNAIDEIIAAGAAIRLTPSQEEVVSSASRRGPLLIPMPSQAIAEAFAAEQGNRHVYEHLRRAVSRPAASCDAASFALLGTQGRRLFDLLRVSAIAARQGDAAHPPRHDDSVAYILDSLHLAEAIDRCGTAGTRVVATAWYAVITDLIIETAPDLQVTDDSANHTASRAQVAALIDALLDERIPQAAARDAVLDEQLAALAHVRQDRPGGWLLSPAYQRDAAYTIQACMQARVALAKTTWPQIFAGMPVDRADYYDYVMAPSRSLFESTARRSALWHVRSLVDRRAAATRLALRLYEIETGRLPAELDQLVPDYIASLPADMFDAQARPLQYGLDDIPRLFSVGAEPIDYGWGIGRRRGMGPRSFRWRESGPVYPLSRPMWRLTPDESRPSPP